MTEAKKRRIRPIEAWRAMRILLRDKEDTAQVFRFVTALTGNSQHKGFERFRTSETGRRILSENRQLLTALSDRNALAKCPEGSLGRAYLDFVYGHDLSADGLVAASKEGSSRRFDSPEEELYANRLRDMHDLWHVVTGYGRDGLGELCLLAFSYAQTRNRGVGVIVLVGIAKVRREAPQLPIVRAALEGYRNGKASGDFTTADWEALLQEPLEAVRAKLRVRPATVYRQAERESWRIENEFQARRRAELERKAA